MTNTKNNLKNSLNAAITKIRKGIHDLAHSEKVEKAKKKVKDVVTKAKRKSETIFRKRK